MVHGSDTSVSGQLRLLRQQRCKGKLCVRRNGMTPKTRRFIVTSGFGPNHNLGVYNNNVDTIERAFTERYFLCKDGEGFRPAFEVGPSGFKGTHFREFQNRVLLNMPRLPRLTRQQVVDAYTGPKRKVYERALDSLYKDDVTEDDAKLTSFVKFEKQDVEKAPRCINPRSARYNLELGTFLKHSEHHYFDAINAAFGQRTRATVIKGFNADVSADVLRAKWDLFDDPVAIGLDASKFDMHVSRRALQYEHDFYKRLYPGSRKLKWLLSLQLKNSGVAYAADGEVRFEMEGTRSSGDLNTSLGNCLLMCGMVYAYARHVGVRLELANNGDDCVVFMEADDACRFRASLAGWFRRRGFAMTVEDTVDDFEAVEFCQTKPVQLSSGWRMVRNLDACMQKDPMCMVPVPNSKVLRKWYGAVGECGTKLTQGVPVLSSFYHAFVRHGTEAGDGFMREVYRNQSQLQKMVGVKSAVVTPESRVSFYYAFGVLPDAQVELEAYYANLKLDVGLGQIIERDDLELNPGFNVIINPT